MFAGFTWDDEPAKREDSQSEERSVPRDRFFEDEKDRMTLTRLAPQRISAESASRSAPLGPVALLDQPPERVTIGNTRRLPIMRASPPELERPRASRRTAWLAMWLLLAGVLGLMSLSGPKPPDGLSPPALAAASASRSALPTRNIEDVQLGDRLTGRNPLREEVEEDLSDLDPQTWRKISLRMGKGTVDQLDMELLRPLDWIAAENVKAGATMYLDMTEMGARGEAEVVSIEPCPPIKAGKGNIVTGRYIHVAGGRLVDLLVAGASRPIRCTDNHFIWSVDRQAFVESGKLRAGEHVHTSGDMVREVVSITPRSGQARVYNLEVLGEHVYEVSDLGVLVHNSRLRGAKKAPSGRGGPYGHIEDGPSVGSGKNYTGAQKRKILAENRAKNNGVLRDDVTGEIGQAPSQSRKGVTPPDNEVHVDHYYPKSEGGPNSYSNAEVRLRKHNLKKSNKIP